MVLFKYKITNSSPKQGNLNRWDREIKGEEHQTSPKLILHIFISDTVWISVFWFSSVSVSKKHSSFSASTVAQTKRKCPAECRTTYKLKDDVNKQAHWHFSFLHVLAPKDLNMHFAVHVKHVIFPAITPKEEEYNKCRDPSWV